MAVLDRHSSRVTIAGRYRERTFQPAENQPTKIPWPGSRTTRESATISSLSNDFDETRLRACQRIGEISRDPATNERARTDLHPSDGKQTKTQQLAEADISTSTAQRYEQLASHVA